MDKQTQTDIYQQAAVQIGHRLLKDAVHYDNRCNWQGAVLEPVKGQFQVVTRTFGPDLYNGLNGILWFLVELYRIYPSPLVLEAINGALKNIHQQIQDADAQLGTFSLHSGRLGVGFSLWRAGTMLNAPQWVEEGMTIVNSLFERDIPDHEIDVIGGAAGAIGALLRIYQVHSHHGCLEQAVKLGEFLMARANKSDDFWFWSQHGSAKGLTGYSHGCAGIGLALLELAAVTKDDTFKQAAYAAFAFEQYNYDAQHQNWPDLRELNANVQYNYMWCHGAPGIALSRLRAFELTGDQVFLDEALVALESTWRNLYQDIAQASRHLNFSLCHGAAGNAEILMMGAKLSGQAKYETLAHHVAHLGLQRFLQTDTDLPSGVHDNAGHGRSGEYTPGLMLGASGTGLFYLRMAHPESVETVLHIR